MEINKIYNENCLETMSKIQDDFIDLTVTSPPYDKLRTYDDDIDKTWGEHVWKPVIKELYRITKKGGVVVWVVGDSTINGSETGTSFKQALWAMECGFNLHDTMIYQKQNYIPLTHGRYEQEFEFMFVFSKGKPKTFNPIMIKTKFPDQKYDMSRKGYGFKEGAVRRTDRTLTTKTERIKGNIFIYPVGNSGLNHPAVFPEELAKQQIASWSNEGDLVYDPFMGSGTTAKMAHLLKRNWIGSELSKKYVELANKRLDPYLAQQTLF
jgi:DNA modification methylase